MKTVTEMANEAGLVGGPVYAKGLEKFAELVTEQANARANNSWTLMCKKMVEAEREACAKVAEDMNRAVLAMLNVTSQPKALAAAIRTRSNT